MTAILVLTYLMREAINLFDFGVVEEALLLMFKNIHTTLSLSLLSFAIAIVLSVVFAAIQYFNTKGIIYFVRAYVSFFRGTPLLAQLFFFYFGVPNIFPIFKEITGFTAATIGLGLNAAAYMTETIRGSIISVDKGQMEASLSVGMTNIQAMRRIVLPQAIRVALPSLSNTFIDLIKGSSLAFTVGVFEITAVAQSSAAVNYRYFECYVSLMAMYWILTFVFGRMQQRIEYSLGRGF